MSKVIVKKFESYAKTIPEILGEAGLVEKIRAYPAYRTGRRQAGKDQKQILIKPNLTINLPPPCTTSIELVEEVIKFCRKNSRAKIIVAEGSGGCDSEKAFGDLGFRDLARKYKIELLDLNQAERIEKENPKALKLKKVLLPAIAFESYIINLAVLKNHSAVKMTAAMKNVFGFYLNKIFIRWPATRSFSGGWWNKSELHMYGVPESIIDLCRYIHFDFNIVDASIGQRKSEVHGQPCDPPIGKIIAGFDAHEVDKICAPLLNLAPKEIKYL